MENNPHKNKKTTEDYWKNAISSSKVIRRQAKISTLNNLNRRGESLIRGQKGQGNSSIRKLDRQERPPIP